MTNGQKIKAVQGILGVTADGLWGPLSRRALERLIQGEIVHLVKATSFADPLDVARYRLCKSQGKSDQECFKVGDNGVGFWDNPTVEGTGPCCALPPEDLIERWGSVEGAHLKPVIVSGNGASVTCLVKDTMPRKANITNGAGIDLNPDATRALGHEPHNFSLPVSWQWA